jgi:hypothetical protein
LLDWKTSELIESFVAASMLPLNETAEKGEAIAKALEQKSKGNLLVPSQSCPGYAKTIGDERVSL